MRFFGPLSQLPPRLATGAYILNSGLNKQNLEGEAFVRYWNAHEKRPFRWRFSGNFEGPRRAAA